MNFSSNYYDQPEGKDLTGKMIATNRMALAGGLVFSMYDVILYSKTQGYLPTIARIASITGPCVGMASAFTLGTYTATNIRGKDDMINYAIGGYCAGAIYGSWKRSVAAGVGMGSVFAIMGLVKKLSKIEGWEFFPEVKGRGWGGIRPHDYTLMKDPGKKE